MKNAKRAFAAALCCLCLLGAAQPGLAVAADEPAESDGFQLFWSTLSTITLSMTYSGGKVHWGGSISGNSNVTGIGATYTLEKRNSNGTYAFVDDWDYSGTATYLDSSDSKTTAKGTYRLTVNVTVTTSSGITEYVSNDLVKTFS